jgi:hypothetical protein
MREAMIGEPYCSLSSGGLVNPKETNCGSPVASVFFFVMTFLSINYVLLNLLIAIILDNFSDTQALSESVVTEENLSQFNDAWAEFDPTSRGWIESSKLDKFILCVDFPLGLKNIPMTHLHNVSLRQYSNRLITELNIPQYMTTWSLGWLRKGFVLAPLESIRSH